MRQVASSHSVFRAMLGLLAAGVLALISSAPASAASGWYHDPVSPAARRAEVPVPSQPGAVIGPLEQTVAMFRAADGHIAVPVRWAFGHSLLRGQALVFNSSGLFDFNSATPTAAARAAVARLTSALELVRGVRCEGYADFGGSPSNEQRLSDERAHAICALIAARRPSIGTESVGYGSSRPVLVGGTQAQRAANRRVIVEVTKVKPEPTPESPASGSEGIIVTTGPQTTGTTTSSTTTTSSRTTSSPTTTTSTSSASSTTTTSPSTTTTTTSTSPTTTTTTSPTTTTTTTSPTTTTTTTSPTTTTTTTPTTTTTTTTTSPTTTTTTTPTTTTTTTTTSPTTTTTTTTSSTTTTTSGSPATVPSEPEITYGFAYASEEYEWEIHLEFHPPAEDGGSPILEYLYSENGGEFEPLYYTEGSPYEGLIDTGDACSSFEAEYTIVAVNSVGESLASNEYLVKHAEEEC